MATKTSPSSASSAANTRSGLPPVSPPLHTSGSPSLGPSILQVSSTFDNLTVSDVKKSSSSESFASAISSTSASANGTIVDASSGIEKESSSSSLASSASASGGARKKKGRPPRFSLQTLSVQYDTSCILDHVYLGAKNVTDDAETLEKLGITCIINCTEETSKRDDEDHGIKYLQVKIGDTPAENIAKYFEVTGQLINETKKSQGKCLVHCSMGMSRSCTIVLAYLMKYEGMTLAKALIHTKERRPVVSPNPGFMKQLIDYEKEIYNGKGTINLEKYTGDRFGDVIDYAE